MTRKRKVSSLKSKKQEDEQEQEEEVEEEEQQEQEQEQEKRNKKIKTPKTLKEKILTILSNSNTLLGLQKIKKILITEYDMKETKVFNANVNKTLKLLSEDKNEIDRFGKIGGSYHGGIRSQAYLSHEREQREKQELKKHIDDGEVLCPYCNLWCSDECFVREDSVARGGLYLCEHCSEEFWTWISDGYSIGHKVEYRYGDGSDDYADLNRGKRR